MIALALLLATQAAPVDAEPPTIEDVAAAASNPDASPVITVMMSDHGSGVGSAFVHFRAKGGEWQRADLKGGTSGMFIARLPDGTQRSGFEYWIEATDIACHGPMVPSESSLARYTVATGTLPVVEPPAS